MYAYLRGTYKGHASESDEVVLIEVSGVGYEVIVPPIVEQDISARHPIDAEIVLFVKVSWPSLKRKA